MTRLVSLALVFALASRLPIHAQEKKDPPKEFTNSLGMKFVWIPPGTFVMGSPATEKKREFFYENQRKVTLTRGFYMGVYLVTQEEWKKVMGKNPSHFKDEKDEKKLPVDSVSWDDCQLFLDKLKETDKLPYRLPTEAEWEYACRAGTTTAFHFGATISTRQANHNNNKTTPVDSFPANAWGLHDMHGNLWQWCQDCWSITKREDSVDPLQPNGSNNRVMRGGAWHNTPEFLRSASYGWGSNDARTNTFGFRVCFTPILSDEPKVQLGIPYAEPKNERQMLDVYAPTKGKDLPVVVWIHGGGWRRGDKADVHNKPKAFVDKGFVLVSISYRFVPKVTVNEIASDVAKAIRWTHDHAKDYGGDPNSIIVMGHSAGAQLAALVCTDDRYLKAEKLSLSIIKACVPVDGDTYDVPLQIKTVEGKRAKSYRMTFGDDESQKNLSSVTHVAKGKNIPPFLILHVADHPETKMQSQRLVKVLQEAGISAKAYPAEGKNHTTINNDLGLSGDRPTQEMWEFLGVVLKK